MTQPSAPAVETVRAIDSSLMIKVFYAFAGMALLSLAISLFGKWMGASIVMAGHTDDTTVQEIVIGNNVIAAPANAIRFERARHDGVTNRLDLYMRWPDLQGYSEAARDDFNHAAGSRSIIFVSFEERSMSRDMSGRFAPIYASMIEKAGVEGPAGVTLYAFTKQSGYLNETLAVAKSPDGSTFVARCLTGPSAEESLAPCERDIHIGDNLSLTYRFPRQMLGQWSAMDTAIVDRANTMLHVSR